MSHLTREQVLKLAKLSQLTLSDEEVTKYQKELSSILEYVERLNEVDVTGLKPTYQVSGIVNDVAHMREDTIASNQVVTPKSLMEIVPRSKDGYVQVGRMI